MEYAAERNKESVEIYELDKYLSAIKARDEYNIQRIKNLEQENERLKSENYRNEEFQKMKTELEKLNNQIKHGFLITDEELDSIEEWKIRHAKEKHGLKTTDDRLRAAGTIGGGFVYKFTPTTIGEIGEIQCHCGEKFCFRELF